MARRRLEGSTRPEAASSATGTTNPRWDGITRDYTADDVVRLRGSIDIEHTLARAGRRAALGAAARRAVRRRARRAHRQPGHPEGARRPQGDLPQRLAGRGRRQPRRARCIPTRASIPSNSVPQVVKRINHALQRADQIDHAEGQERHATGSRRSWPTPRPASAARSTRSS